MNQLTIHQVISQFDSLLPSVLQWVEEYCSQYADQAIPVAQFGFQRLGQYFSIERLRNTRVVQVDHISFPPLTHMGFPYLQKFEKQRSVGITYKDIYFLTCGAYSCEATHFHELVHVVQWEKLGPERFVTIYGIGLLVAGYHQCPLEKMAYEFEELFIKGTLIPDLEQIIQIKTAEIAAIDCSTVGLYPV